MRRTEASYAALYSSKFISLGIQLPFFSGWLHWKGLTASEIGLLTGLALGARLVLGPFVALWADRRRDPRTGLRAVSAVFALSSMFLALAPGKSAIAAAGVAMLWAFGVLVPLADTAALRADRAGELHFGRTRAFGSSAFLLTTLIGGEALTRLGLDASVAIMAGAASLTLLASLILPPAAPRSPAANPFEDAGKLLGARTFVAALAASALIQGAHATYYSFSALRWSELGYAPRIIGALWAAGVIAEIVLLTRMKGLVRRLGPQRLMMIGAAGATVRWLATAAEPPLAILFLVQTLHALSFAATYMGMIEFIDRAVPARLVNTAMAVNSTAGVGAMTGLATVSAGFLFQSQGASAAWLLMAAMASAGFACAFALSRVWKGERLFE